MKGGEGRKGKEKRKEGERKKKERKETGIIGTIALRYEMQFLCKNRLLRFLRNIIIIKCKVNFFVS